MRALWLATLARLLSHAMSTAHTCSCTHSRTAMPGALARSILEFERQVGGRKVPVELWDCAGDQK